MAEWTKEDEAAYEAMRKRREEVIGAQEKKLHALVSDLWAATLNRGPDTLHQADRAKSVEALSAALKLFPYAVREALAPYDFGPPPAAPEPERVR